MANLVCKSNWLFLVNRDADTTHTGAEQGAALVQADAANAQGRDLPHVRADAGAGGGLVESGRWSGVALVAPGHPATQQVSSGNSPSTTNCFIRILFFVDEYTAKLNMKMYCVTLSKLVKVQYNLVYLTS